MWRTTGDEQKDCIACHRSAGLMLQVLEVTKTMHARSQNSSHLLTSKIYIRILCANPRNPAGSNPLLLSLLHVTSSVIILITATLLARFPKLSTPYCGL